MFISLVSMLLNLSQVGTAFEKRSLDHRASESSRSTSVSKNTQASGTSFLSGRLATGQLESIFNFLVSFQLVTKLGSPRGAA